MCIIVFSHFERSNIVFECILMGKSSWSEWLFWTHCNAHHCNDSWDSPYWYQELLASGNFTWNILVFIGTESMNGPFPSISHILNCRIPGKTTRPLMWAQIEEGSPGGAGRAAQGGWCHPVGFFRGVETASQAARFRLQSSGFGWYKIATMIIF